MIAHYWMLDFENFQYCFLLLCSCSKSPAYNSLPWIMKTCHFFMTCFNTFLNFLGSFEWLNFLLEFMFMSSFAVIFVTWYGDVYQLYFQFTGKMMNSERIRLMHFVVWLMPLARISKFLFHQYTNFYWNITCGSLFFPNLFFFFPPHNLLKACLKNSTCCSTRNSRKLKGVYRDVSH